MWDLHYLEFWWAFNQYGRELSEISNPIISGTNKRQKPKNMTAARVLTHHPTLSLVAKIKRW